MNKLHYLIELHCVILFYKINYFWIIKLKVIIFELFVWIISYLVVLNFATFLNLNSLDIC
jgi:hypothetical protein